MANELPNPITRDEKYLAKATGMEVDIPTPITRVEEYLNAIAQGSGTSGGIILVGETTTALEDNATTNPITVDGQSYTAQPNDAVIYQNKEFLFDGTKWHEFGDLSGLSSKDIGSMTNYAKAQTGAEIETSDTLNQAIGKVEKRISDNENNISLIQQTIGDINTVLEGVL